MFTKNQHVRLALLKLIKHAPISLFWLFIRNCISLNQSRASPQRWRVRKVADAELPPYQSTQR